MSRRKKNRRSWLPAIPANIREDAIWENWTDTAQPVKYAVTEYVPRADVVTYGEAELGHVVLMGDSILDNEHYTYDEPDVAQRLHGVLGDDWAVSLVARDGATTRSIGWQYRHVPDNATHIVVSIGGNDANGNHKILLDQTPRVMFSSLEELYLMAEEFAADYAEAMQGVLDLGIPVTVCTIYQCDFSERERYAIKPALALFNDVIIEFALKHHLQILDLRAVCTEPEDYEMAIEPSAIGGAKIGRAIAEAITAGS